MCCVATLQFTTVSIQLCSSLHLVCTALPQLVVYLLFPSAALLSVNISASCFSPHLVTSQGQILCEAYKVLFAFPTLCVWDCIQLFVDSNTQEKQSIILVFLLRQSNLTCSLFSVLYQQHFLRMLKSSTSESENFHNACEKLLNQLRSIRIRGCTSTLRPLSGEGRVFKIITLDHKVGGWGRGVNSNQVLSIYNISLNLGMCIRSPSLS